MEKYLYFRTETSINDDDDENTSIIVPISRIRGIYAAGATPASVSIYFESQDNISSGDIGEGTACDHVSLNINTSKQQDIMSAITNAINTDSTGGLITVADDITGEYIGRDITSVGTIVTNNKLT